MKVLMDGRNHGAGTNGNGACSINQSNCGNLYCNCYGIKVDVCGINASNKKNESKKENC